MDLILRDSSFRFTDPPRFFKENDPYYFHVDNLGAKQIHENTMWLKDQVTGGIGVSAVERTGLDELRPYSPGTDNKVYVRPGRYTSRVNDVSQRVPLQSVLKVQGDELVREAIWRFSTYASPALQTDLDDLTKADTGIGKMLNGLAERVFTYPVLDPNNPLVDYSQVGDQPILFPLGRLWKWNNIDGDNNYNLAANLEFNALTGMAYLSYVESDLMKYWRGVARTAIVDVPAELSIEVPVFDEDDFDWEDEDGNRQEPTPDPAAIGSRIDLVFIYSKPVDVVSVAVADGSQTGRVIQAPELGILKGAGAVFSKALQHAALAPTTSGVESDGTPKMLAHGSDQLESGNGFENENVRGSFPAPDDLLNITPLLSEQLESEHPSLIGQTILPVAYIVRRRDATVNNLNQQLVADTDVIDIRPLMRTTELSYNERTGVAAAMPQLSLANPAVGKVELDHQVKRVYDDLVGQINIITRTGSQTAFPRVVGSGYVFGGTNYGPEATVSDYYQKYVDPTANQARLTQLVVDRLGFPSNAIIPAFPGWDVANWVAENSQGDPGIYPNDYMNYFIRDSEADVNFGCYGDSTLTDRLTRFGTEHRGDNNETEGNRVNVVFVKKTFRIDRAAVDWMEDYHIDVRYVNCAPLGTRATSENQQSLAGAADVWVSKGRDEFTIYCAWVPQDWLQVGSEHATLAGAAPEDDPTSSKVVRHPLYNRDVGAWAGWAVITEEMARQQSSFRFVKGEYNGGVSIYPTIQFSITGTPASYQGLFTNINNTNPVLTLI